MKTQSTLNEKIGGIVLSGGVSTILQIQDGTRNQFRVPISPQPSSWPKSDCFRPTMEGGDAVVASHGIEIDRRSCPFGKPGDRFILQIDWVTEYNGRFTWWKSPADIGIVFATEGVSDFDEGRHDARQMPFWLSERFRLPIIEIPHSSSETHNLKEPVRCERLQDMTWADAVAEGIKDSQVPSICLDSNHLDNPIRIYKEQWDINNPNHLWKSNPHTWVCAFHQLM